MRTEIKQIELRKYFVTCPDCGQERQVNGYPITDSLCTECTRTAVTKQRDDMIALSRDMFTKLQADISGDFTLDEDLSYEEMCCCIYDQFTLIGSSGARYKFTTYDNRLELESIDE